jgi:hypothetical protein
MIKCEEHNWLYEEFDEPCPLCDAVKVNNDRIVKLIRKYVVLTGGEVFRTSEVLKMLEKDVINGELD